ncbi:MAG TPA: DUF6325 family protein [Streptosporangiaceae bacterium]|nr:DUF6325 family protein [Streptosporangiaceae bacterium]
MPAALEADAIGPVDVAVIAFEGNDFNGDVAPALADLQASGTVRVIDVAFLRKEADGATAVVEVADAAIAEAFDRITGSQVDLLNDADLSNLATALEPDSSAMVVVWENSWATRFASAVRESHGQVAVFERIPHENVAAAIAALNET